MKYKMTSKSKSKHVDVVKICPVDGDMMDFFKYFDHKEKVPTIKLDGKIKWMFLVTPKLRSKCWCLSHINRADDSIYGVVVDQSS